MNHVAIVREKISQAELLSQLAEEASELTHAALKLRRVYDGTNPTPVRRREAFEALLEEVADVLLLLQVLHLDGSMHATHYQKTMNAKLARWVKRLLEAEEG